MRRVLWILSCSSFAFAQINLASLSGTVADSTSAPVSGARVAARAKATGALRNAVTDDGGLFEISNLVPGAYSVELEKAGFAPFTRDIVLEVGQRMSLDLTLSIGARHEVIDVGAPAELLKTQDVSLG